MFVLLTFAFSASLFAAGVWAGPQEPAREPKVSKVAIVQPSLTAPGSPAFDLQATITDTDDPQNPTTVEMHWVNGTKWRREIKSSDFSQTLIVNGADVYDEHSDDYVPLPIETLITAMTDPDALLATMGPADRAYTKANGAANDSGVVCFGAAQSGKINLCRKGQSGLREIANVPGRPVQFTDYRMFFGRNVAREIITTPEIGVSYIARITLLSLVERADPDLFVIKQPTPANERLRTVLFSEAELRALLPTPPQIVWPQVLDGSTKGRASYFVSVDRDGHVRETVVVRSDNERANDSARRQIMRWKFTPPTKEGVAVQAEGILNFALDTRAWGPAAILTDKEVRQLAADIVEPSFPSGAAPSGSTSKVLIAVDADGKVIEMIAGDGPTGLFTYCMKALNKWHFAPVMENGQPRPYRAEVEFHVQ